MKEHNTVIPKMQPPLNTVDTEKLEAFIQQSTYAMSQLRSLFDVLTQSKDMDFDITAFASNGWEITSDMSAKCESMRNFLADVSLAAKGVH